MINAIGAMHAALRAKKKSPEDKINFRVEVKKRRRPRDDDDDDHDKRDRRLRERSDKRGVVA
ncbi:MAG: hypothetical protein JNJ73_13605 [Hyphomonadaceae bacterium]|nr:hypothetical protein [Hyphomonadaceae bacterium]